MSYRYETRHYEDVAGLLRDRLQAAQAKKHDVVSETIRIIVEDFIVLFEGDNPRFDRRKFWEAVTGAKGRV